MFHELWESYKSSKQHVAFKVIWGQWQWRYSISHVRFPIGVPCNAVFILHRFRYIIAYFPKFKEVTWLWAHPFGSNISCMHSYSSVSISTRNLKFIASPITKIWLEAKFKQEAQLPQRDRETRYVSKFTLHFTRNGS